MTPRAQVAAWSVFAVVCLAGGARDLVIRRRRGARTAGPLRLTRSIEGLRHRWALRAGTRDEAVAAWLEATARQLRSGGSLVAATLESTASAPDALRTILTPLTEGLSRARSLGEAVGEVPAPPGSSLSLALAVVRTCARLGGGTASPLERAAATIRMREAVRAEFATHSAQARLSARVMAVLPLAVVALLAIVSPSTRQAVTSGPGAACIALGLALGLVGHRWMARIIRGRDELTRGRFVVARAIGAPLDRRVAA